MSIDTLEKLSIVSYIVSIVFFIIAVVLFFVFKIPNTIGYLTGSNRQKGVAQLRRKSEEISDNTASTFSQNIRTGNLNKTEQIKRIPLFNPDGMPQKKNVGMQTTLLSEETAVLESCLYSENDSRESDNTVSISEAIEILMDITFIHTNEIIG